MGSAETVSVALVERRGMSIISKWRDYGKDPVWRSRLGELNGLRFFRVKLYRVLILSLRGFFDDQLKASALTYYSVLSVVPVVALLFGIARGFGYENVIKQQLLEKLSGQKEVVSRITQFAHSLLEHTQSSVIAGLGLIFLFYSVLSVLMSIENYFNEIWHVSEGRPIKRKITDYLSFMLIAPVLLILSSGLTVFFSTEVKTVVQRIEILGTVSPVISYIFSLSPYFTTWLLFTFMYIFMPCTRVRFASGALAGLIGGIMFQLCQWVYITFQIGVSRYNAIYGSFAALPIFLIWMQLSWLIALFGAKFSYAYQNAALYDYEADCRNSSLSVRILLSLSVVQLLVRRFLAGEPPYDEAMIADRTGIPSLLLGWILENLVSARVLSRVEMEGLSAMAYQPARSVGDLTIEEVIEAMERKGSNHVPAIQSEELLQISRSLKAFKDLIEGSPENKRLVDL